VRCRWLDMGESLCGIGHSPCSARSCAWIAVVEAHHAALRTPSHSSMKAENWFQLRIVGVTAIREPGFCRACAGYYRRAPEVISRLKDTANEHVP
jgi:hypothetical protein